MSYLLDTNVLLRWVQPDDPERAVAVAAVDALWDKGEEISVTAQNIIEFWNVATRPQEANGIGLTPEQAETEVAQIEALFPILLDTADIYPAWRKLVKEAGVCGVQVHDARLAAVMRVHGISHLLTFNVRDFQRFGGLTVVRPGDVTTQAMAPSQDE
jgi:predicted nucleic acid-binding protein